MRQLLQKQNEKNEKNRFTALRWTWRSVRRNPTAAPSALRKTPSWWCTRSATSETVGPGASPCRAYASAAPCTGRPPVFPMKTITRFAHEGQKVDGKNDREFCSFALPPEQGRTTRCYQSLDISCHNFDYHMITID